MFQYGMDCIVSLLFDTRKQEETREIISELFDSIKLQKGWLLCVCSWHVPGMSTWHEKNSEK